ncbi:MAG: large conductance mechanosensitive channel protein MscL, partial [Phycisphaerae bacterium]|nr:large conductance mechanosensitive channel protein MscL [Phycisphaerae bacterium]
MSFKKLLTEFKAFALQGNVIDLAVAFVIGAAFKQVVDALVNDIIMPLIGLIQASMPGGAQSYETWQWHHFLFGHLLATIINFLLVAAAVFIVIVKIVGGVLKAASAKPAAPSEPVT